MRWAVSSMSWRVSVGMLEWPRSASEIVVMW